MQRLMTICCLAGSVAFGTQAHGVTLGQVDDFNDTTTQGWGSGGSNPVAPANLLNSGQAGSGDHVLHVQSTSSFGGPGSKPTFFNNAQWTGDYLAAGITAITFDINNLSDVPVSPGLELRSSSGNIFTLSNTTIPAGSGWQSVTLSLDPGNFFGPDVLGTLANVTQLRFRNMSGGSFVTPSGATTTYYDNITAVPEPASLALLSLGAPALLRRRG